MDDVEPPKVIGRGTRPFEAMVPCKPWTSKFLSVDEITSQQSRRGPNSQRFKDGALRPDRPLPPGKVQGQPPTANSARAYQRPDVTWFWENPGTTPGETTTKTAYQGFPAAPRDAPATRHALSPRFAKSTVGDIMFGDPLYQNFSDRTGRPVAPPMVEVDAPRAASNTAELRNQLTDEQRIRHLEIALRHEKRMTESARANLKTNLRGGSNPTMMVGLHEPAGCP